VLPERTGHEVYELLLGICLFGAWLGASGSSGAGGGVWASAVATRAFTGVVSSMLAVLGGILMTLACVKAKVNITAISAQVFRFWDKPLVGSAGVEV
jgi:hypothetical protein